MNSNHYFCNNKLNLSNGHGKRKSTLIKRNKSIRRSEVIIHEVIAPSGITRYNERISSTSLVLNGKNS